MRLDVFLVSNGFCDSRNKAQNFINESRVFVNGKQVNKPSFDVKENDKVEVCQGTGFDYVGRGGNKLEHAIDTFKIDVADKICVDIGASTGGFTQCLLLKGAKKVFAVDSGTNQLSEVLKNDQRVVSIEGFNARNLSVSELDNSKVDVAVMDVSFISQKLLYPALLSVVKSGGDIITLIKPQFESGKSALNKNGIVKDEKTRNNVVNEIIEYAKNMGFEYISHCQSPITGGDGNIEFLMHLKTK